MISSELRQKFLRYFEDQGHKVVPSSSLIPDNDTSVLLTTAGMQQFKPYFRGEKDPTESFGSRNLVSVQKCFRTSDIEEVGDLSHLTFFEMLGNFSLGGYSKKEAIKYSWEIMTDPKWYGLVKDKFSSSIFSGDNEIEGDHESEQIWEEVAPGIEVRHLGREDNFWPSPIWVGTCGPSTELSFFLNEKNLLEIWNIVFTQYFHTEDNQFKDLGRVNIDTGMGLERLAIISQGKQSIFDTDLFTPIIKKVEELVGTNYGADSSTDRRIRIIADHSKAITFLIADGVEPSNKERGYILRRLIRRALTHGKLLKEDFSGLQEIMEVVVEMYGEVYHELKSISWQILEIEENKFKQTLASGLKEFEKTQGDISGAVAFLLFSSFGFPLELVEELARESGRGVDTGSFEELLKEHQEKSRN